MTLNVFTQLHLIRMLINRLKVKVSSKCSSIYREVCPFHNEIKSFIQSRPIVLYLKLWFHYKIYFFAARKICRDYQNSRSLLKPLYFQVEGSEEYIIETVDAVECRHWLMLIQSSRQNSVSRCLSILILMLFNFLVLFMLSFNLLLLFDTFFSIFFS